MAVGKKRSLVALSDRREYAIDLLTQRFADGVLDMEEFEERVDLAHRADTVAALEEVIQDLEPADADADEALEENDEEEHESQALAVRSNASLVPRQAEKTAVAIMGGIERKGAWTPPERMKVWTVLGGAVLDFREAVLPPGVTEVKIRSIMGGVEIIVPPQVAVDSEGMGIMGGFEDMHRAPRDPDPDRPLLRVSGVVIMGGCSIETRMPGETRRQARRREKRERRALRETSRARLQGERKRLPKGRRELGDGDDT